MHVDCDNLTVVIGPIVVNALVLVAAAGIDRDLIFIRTEAAESALLLDTAKNMEELVHR